MITNIKLHNIATYTEPVEVNDLKKINFIYGSNGTGKTTLSNFLYNPSDANFSNCTKKWENDNELEILVYNKKFREDYFGKGKLNGVFTLGKATKEQIDTINTKKEELKNYREQYIKRKSSLDKLIEDNTSKVLSFQEKIWKGVFQKHKTNFKEAFIGSMKSKSAFYERIIKEFKENNVPLLELDVLKASSETIFGETPKHITPFPVINFDRLLEIEEDSIWQKKVIGKADVEIAKLIQKLNINDWVIKGREYLVETDETCPFCQEDTITVDFKKQLDDFFDENFTKDLKNIKDFNDEYLGKAKTLVNQLNQIEKDEKENKKTKLNISLFSANLKTLISEFSTNKEYLQNKISEPSREINLKSIKQQLDSLNELLIEANTSIESHNKIVLDYTKQRKDLIDSIWKYLVEDNRADIDNYVKELNSQNKAI
ncbi:AAA family ATPase, partial [Tenacibaculum maritimum]|uniref:AAA family ATPase n=1 Tax=Tenacibaculum maritimum TaxID=107401 RepID=UPI003877713A